MSTKKITELTTFTDRFVFIIGKIKEKYGINQSKIASELGMSTAALSKLIKGVSKSAAGTTLTSLQIKYRVNPVWLTELEGEPFIEEQKKWPLSSMLHQRLKYAINIVKEMEGFSDKDIAEHLDLSEDELRGIIEGKNRHITHSFLQSLESIGVNPDWVVKQEGEPLISIPPGAPLNPFLPEEMVEIKHMKEMLTEKNNLIQALNTLVEELKADKERLNKTIDRLHTEIDGLKRELTALAESRSSA